MMTIVLSSSPDVSPDKCHDSGSDPSAVIADIAALINTSAVLIGKLDKDVLGLLNGQLVLITNMVIRITLVSCSF